VVSGSDEEGRNNPVPEVYTPGAGLMPLAAAQLSLPNYPYLFVLPDGRVFYAGPSNPTRTLEVGPQIWTPVGNSQIGGGSAVMYAPGQVLKSGGGDPATARAVIIDMTQESPAWREVAPMAFPRRRHNLTVLPDGKVLVTGGTQVGNEEAQAVYAAELWDPVSESWTTLASMQVARMYHSTALLLPDGRVLSAGGNGKLSAELYAPPYLFAGPPPEIAAAPARLAYGASFEVATPEAASIAAVALLRPSAVTHAYNQEQRYIRLRFEPTEEGALAVQAPADANLALPGYYMLFLVTTTGVPSRAWFLQIGGEQSTPGARASLRVGSIRPRDDATGER
jgi:Domain of unknown function (DUF1929)/Galactose oxidase, central domain